MTEYIILDDFIPDEVISSAKGQGYLSELVRCKDCKNWKITGIVDNVGYCMLNVVTAIGTKSDWFCADGKRKEGQ